LWFRATGVVLLTHQRIILRTRCLPWDDSETRYRSLFKLSAEGMAVYRGEELLAANAAPLDMLGCTSFEEFRRVPSSDHVSPEYRD